MTTSAHQEVIDRVAGALPGARIEISVDLAGNVNSCIQALSRDENLFQRDGTLVHVVHTTETDESAMWKVGSPRVRPIKLPALRVRSSLLTTWVQWKPGTKTKGGDWVETLPPKHVIEAVLAADEWRDVRPLVGVSETPFLRPDGTVCDVNGYDRQTGYLLERATDFDQTPSRWHEFTKADAEAALQHLAEPFEEFPWATPAAKYAAIATVLTMVARPAIRGACPALAIDKNAPGTGGTLAANVVSIIATGRHASMLSWPPDDVELEKVFAALALSASTLVTFDNVSTALKGGPLDKVLTCQDRVQLRVLGQSEVPELQWRAQVVMTGNNIEVQGDTIRRVLMARMDSPLERPEDRDGFKHPNLCAWVKEHRAELVHAALTVLAAYCNAGRPRTLRDWGSFEAWSSLIPEAIVFAGGVNPMETRVRDVLETGDVEAAAFATFVRRLPELVADGDSAKGIIGTLFPHEVDRRGPRPPDGWEDLRDAIELLSRCAAGKSPDPLKLGYALRKRKGRIVGGRRLVCAPNRDKIGIWRSDIAAGDAGLAGDVLNPRTRGEINNVKLDGLETSPASPSSPAERLADCDPRFSDADGLFGAA